MHVWHINHPCQTKRNATDRFVSTATCKQFSTDDWYSLISVLIHGFHTYRLRNGTEYHFWRVRSVIVSETFRRIWARYSEANHARLCLHLRFFGLSSYLSQNTDSAVILCQIFLRPQPVPHTVTLSVSIIQKNRTNVRTSPRKVSVPCARLLPKSECVGKF